jgi:hypothetical protein
VGADDDCGVIARVEEQRPRLVELCAEDNGADSSMHKDKPPGIFDLSERSVRYAAGFCFVVGFAISVIVRIGFVLARDHFAQPTPWSGF